MSLLGLSCILLSSVGHVSGQRVGLERPSNFPVSECPERYSCGIENRPPWTREKLTNLNCYCDDLCEAYDDCCDDHPSKLHPTNTLKQLLPAKVFVCKTLGVQYELSNGDARLERFYVVDRCPSHYNDECIRGKCELGSSAAEESFYRLPVNGRVSRILYQNYLCALCNGETDVVFWTGRVDLTEGKYLETHDKPILSQTSTKFFSLRDYELRPCKSVVRHCSRSWLEIEVKERCVNSSQSNAFVSEYATNSLTYRNIDCATCNRVRDTKAGCFEVRYVSPFNVFRLPDRKPSVRLSYYVSARGVTTIQTIDYRNRTRSSERFHCYKNDAIYDPFLKDCRPIFCSNNSNHGGVNPNSNVIVHPRPTKPSQCPTGQTMTEEGCVSSTKDHTTPTHNHSPSDNTLPPVKHPKCDRWYVFDRSAKVCRPVKNGIPCPRGHKLVHEGCILSDKEIDNRPLPDRSPKCDRWYVYDRSANICRAIASCKAGYRLTTLGCVLEEKRKCPRWFVYNRETDDCRMAARCPVGYALTNKGCEYRM